MVIVSLLMHRLLLYHLDHIVSGDRYIRSSPTFVRLLDEVSSLAMRNVLNPLFLSQRQGMMSPRTSDSHFTHERGAEGAVAQAEVVLQHGAVGGRVDLAVAIAEDWQVPVVGRVATLRGMVVGDMVSVGAKRIYRLGDVGAADTSLTHEYRRE